MPRHTQHDPATAIRSPARRRIGWLVYASCLTLFVLAGEARNVSRAGAPNLATMANWVLSAALLTAVWCYGLQRPVGAACYWRAVFWIVLGATGLMLVPVAMTGTAPLLFAAVLLLLVAPAYVAAFRYAYRCPQLWRHAQSTDRST